jgi:hypothetical protein
VTIGRFEVRDENAEKMLREIGQALRASCPPGFGFALFVFTMPGAGSMFYTSNAERDSMIQAMQEFIAKFREN